MESKLYSVGGEMALGYNFNRGWDTLLREVYRYILKETWRCGAAAYRRLKLRVITSKRTVSQWRSRGISSNKSPIGKLEIRALSGSLDCVSDRCPHFLSSLIIDILISGRYFEGQKHNLSHCLVNIRWGYYAIGIDVHKLCFLEMSPQIGYPRSVEPFVVPSKETPEPLQRFIA